MAMTIAGAVSVLLALMFLMSGAMKLTQPVARLATRMPFVNDFTVSTVRTIGLLEVLAAVGLILPWVTHILTWLTAVAAIGLVFTMIGAALTHVRRHEQSQVPINAVLLLLAAFVAYERIKHGV